MREIGEFLAPALDLLFPRRCCSCLGSIHTEGESGLCWDCRSGTLPINHPFCECCGAGVAGRVDHAFTCAACEADPPVYRRARSLFRYEGGVHDAIHALKYHHNLSVVPDLAALLRAGLETYFEDLDADAVLVPVPLHRSRLRHRGFNQSLLLAKAIRTQPVSQLLVRMKNTETQTHLTAAQRRTNVRGAFGLHKRSHPLPKTVVLLDDVMTTGATLNAAARVLRVAGVPCINALTLARG